MCGVNKIYQQVQRGSEIIGKKSQGASAETGMKRINQRIFSVKDIGKPQKEIRILILHVVVYEEIFPKGINVASNQCDCNNKGSKKYCCSRVQQSFYMVFVFHTFSPSDSFEISKSKEAFMSGFF